MTARSPTSSNQFERVSLPIPTVGSNAHPASEAESLTVDQNEAAKLTNLSAKTLDRLAKAGQPMGRIKAGRRVLYLRASLERWLVMKAAEPARPSSD